jgi:mannose-6-phosphate isomerase class I
VSHVLEVHNEIYVNVNQTLYMKFYYEPISEGIYCSRLGYVEDFEATRVVCQSYSSTYNVQGAQIKSCLEGTSIIQMRTMMHEVKTEVEYKAMYEM